MSEANKVTLEQIEQLLNEAELAEWIVWGKEMNVSYRLACGFTVTGRAACVDPSNFVEEVGRALCRKNAIEQLWQLEGYRLQWKLYDEGVL